MYAFSGVLRRRECCQIDAPDIPLARRALQGGSSVYSSSPGKRSRPREPVLALPAALSQDDGLEGCVQGEKAQGRLKHSFLLR